MPGRRRHLFCVTLAKIHKKKTTKRCREGPGGRALNKEKIAPGPPRFKQKKSKRKRLHRTPDFKQTRHQTKQRASMKTRLQKRHGFKQKTAPTNPGSKQNPSKSQKVPGGCRPLFCLIILHKVYEHVTTARCREGAGRVPAFVLCQYITQSKRKRNNRKVSRGCRDGVGLWPVFL